MTEYRVTWEIDLDAASPYEAAEWALRIQRDRDSIATMFKVSWSDETHSLRTDHTAHVDLWRNRDR